MEKEFLDNLEDTLHYAKLGKKLQDVAKLALKQKEVEINLVIKDFHCRVKDATKEPFNEVESRLGYLLDEAMNY